MRIGSHKLISFPTITLFETQKGHVVWIVSLSYQFRWFYTHRLKNWFWPIWFNSEMGLDWQSNCFLDELGTKSACYQYRWSHRNRFLCNRKLRNKLWICRQHPRLSKRLELENVNKLCCSKELLLKYRSVKHIQQRRTGSKTEVIKSMFKGPLFVNWTNTFILIQMILLSKNIKSKFSISKKLLIYAGK